MAFRRGLVNKASTCYLLASLQVLFGNSKFRAAVKACGPFLDGHDVGSILQVLCYEMEQVSPEPIDPEVLRGSLPHNLFPKGIQHDAVEAITWLLDKLGSPAQDLFWSTFRQQADNQVTYDIVFRPQYCPADIEDYLQKTECLHAPHILLIQLMRTVINEAGFIVKDERVTDFGPTITIETRTAKHDYRLCGVISHVGPSVKVGHYIAFVREDDDWVKIDDKVIEKCDMRAAQNESAAVLMYEQIVYDQQPVKPVNSSTSMTGAATSRVIDSQSPISSEGPGSVDTNELLDGLCDDIPAPPSPVPSIKPVDSLDDDELLASLNSIPPPPPLSGIEIDDHLDDDELLASLNDIPPPPPLSGIEIDDHLDGDENVPAQPPLPSIKFTGYSDYEDLQ